MRPCTRAFYVASATKQILWRIFGDFDTSHPCAFSSMIVKI
nr:MAG TPA: hypothetical protein [Caudoviricetes sp.]